MNSDTRKNNFALFNKFFSASGKRNIAINLYLVHLTAKTEDYELNSS